MTQALADLRGGIPAGQAVEGVFVAPASGPKPTPWCMAHEQCAREGSGLEVVVVDLGAIAVMRELMGQGALDISSAQDPMERPMKLGEVPTASDQRLARRLAE